MAAAKQRNRKALVLALLSIFCFASSKFVLPAMDSHADGYFENVAAKATAAYAAIRGVNAVVSIIKESEIDIAPAGVGVTVAAGQALDPLDDMTERLSSVVVLAIVSVGIQKIAMEMSRIISMDVLGVVLLLLLIPVWISRWWTERVTPPLIRIICIILVLRLFLPVSSLVDEAVYQSFFRQRIDSAKEVLNIFPKDAGELSSFDMPVDIDDGLWDKLKGAGSEMKAKVERLKAMYTIIRDNLNEIIAALIELTTLYVTFFVFQVLLIPLFMLWVMLKLFDRLFAIPPRNMDVKSIESL